MIRVRQIAHTELERARAVYQPRMQARRWFGWRAPRYDPAVDPTDLEVFNYAYYFEHDWMPATNWLQRAEIFEKRVQNMIDAAEDRDILVTVDTVTELAKNPAKMSDPLFRW